MAETTDKGLRDAESRESSVFEPPTYSIFYGPDHTLRWEPPEDSSELAEALSLHFPTIKGLKNKMYAASIEFLKSEKKGKKERAPETLSIQSDGLESSIPGAHLRGLHQSSDNQATVSRSIADALPPAQRTSQPSFVSSEHQDKVFAQSGKSLPTTEALSIISYNPEIGGFKAKRTKRRFEDPVERKGVAKNRGKACATHQRRKVKCNPALCPENKQNAQTDRVVTGVADLSSAQKTEPHVALAVNSYAKPTTENTLPLAAPLDGEVYGEESASPLAVNFLTVPSTDNFEKLLFDHTPNSSSTRSTQSKSTTSSSDAQTSTPQKAALTVGIHAKGIFSSATVKEQAKPSSKFRDLSRRSEPQNFPHLPPTTRKYHTGSKKMYRSSQLPSKFKNSHVVDIQGARIELWQSPSLQSLNCQAQPNGFGTGVTDPVEQNLRARTRFCPIPGSGGMDVQNCSNGFLPGVIYDAQSSSGLTDGVDYFEGFNDRGMSWLDDYLAHPPDSDGFYNIPSPPEISDHQIAPPLSRPNTAAQRPSGKTLEPTSPISIKQVPPLTSHADTHSHSKPTFPPSSMPQKNTQHITHNNHPYTSYYPSSYPPCSPDSTYHASGNHSSSTSPSSGAGTCSCDATSRAGYGGEDTTNSAGCELHGDRRLSETETEAPSENVQIHNRNPLSGQVSPVYGNGTSDDDDDGIYTSYKREGTRKLPSRQDSWVYGSRVRVYSNSDDDDGGNYTYRREGCGEMDNLTSSFSRVGISDRERSVRVLRSIKRWSKI